MDHIYFDLLPALQLRLGLLRLQLPRRSIAAASGLAALAAAVVVAAATVAVPATAYLPRSGDFCKEILQVSLQSAK